jgi:Ca2+-binding RTX toxin-like protein
MPIAVTVGSTEEPAVSKGSETVTVTGTTGLTGGETPVLPEDKTVDSPADSGKGGDTLMAEDRATELLGGSANDLLIGGKEADTLAGDGGADTLVGGDGDDLYILRDATDLLIEKADGGFDTVWSDESVKLAPDIEALVLTDKDDTEGVGNALDNAMTGNAGDNRLDGGAGADTLAGADGNDVYVVDSGRDLVVEEPGLGNDTVEASLTWTLGDHLEALVLTGGDALNGTGNALDNAITGNDGANRLDGGGGADTLAGGRGNDVYVVDSTTDVTVEAAGAGNDTVEASVSWMLGAEVEALVLTGAATIAGTGNALDNSITGNAAANRLDGGAGADTLAGGAGNDVYVVDSKADAVVEATGAGADTVEAALSWTLGANLEGLLLTGAESLNGTGNTLGNALTGNMAANLLIGLAGNDTLNGGAGADTMVGGTGNDAYVVDSLADVMVEAAGEGADLIQTGFAWTLADVFEHLTLTGGAAVTGTGNAADNAITGNGAANRLEGLLGNDTLNGGGGADTLVGGLGNDTYVVDNLGDQTVEIAGEGTDLVQSSIGWTLGATLENLTLTGSGAIAGNGNASANLVTGNSGANRLNGMGGADTLAGGAGNDTYVVNEAAVVLVEAAGNGTDLVEASLTWTLGAWLENLTLTGTAAINGFGNGLDNVITGNVATNRMEGAAGNDTLNGGGGADTMSGNAGDDLFVVDSADDLPLELAGEGTDLVESSVTWTLGPWLENLRLTGAQPTQGFGNELANRIWGNGAGNRILAMAGDDTVQAAAGEDSVQGGDGADSLLGEAGTDTLLGDAGADTLDGGTEADSMMGGDGNDTYLVDTWGDEAVESSAAGGLDLVLSQVSLTLRDQVENLTLLEAPYAYGGWGNAQDNLIIGNSQANRLDGLAGADTLLGGGGLDTLIGNDGNDSVDGGAGEDSLSGGAGHDTLRGGDANDQLLGGDGNDSAQGDAGDDSAYGGWGDDTLAGGAGADYLDGGAGRDSIAGGAGNDTHVVDDAADRIAEAAGEGVDLVLAAVSWTLGAEFEHLTLLDGTAGTGNALANRIKGNALANQLDGGAGHDSLWGEAGADLLLGGIGEDALDGGAGADTLDGGAGNDSFVVDDAGDVLLDAGGTDRVQATIGWTLGDGFENLVLAGTASLDGTGNALANVITGNAAANRLSGGAGNDVLAGAGGADTLAGDDGADLLDGGAGADSLAGGAGDDRYVVDNAADLVFEAADGGTDLVLAGIGWTLGAALENLTLTGNAAIAGTGNALANDIRGNAAANLLRGGDGADALRGNTGNDTLEGGAGRDTLWGGAGSDVFAFRAIDESAGSLLRADIIGDFAAGDRIDLSAIDANPATLADDAFSVAAAAAARVSWTLIAGDTLVELRLAGSPAPDAAILLSGYTGALSAGSFLL